MDAHLGVQLAEHFFCLWFSFEIVIRYMSFRSWTLCFTDAWFVFDFCLAFLIVCETWVMTTLFWAFDMNKSNTKVVLKSGLLIRLVKLLRLMRMGRMIRLLRAVPEMMFLVKGVMVASRAVFFTLCMLVSVIYVFGIAFTTLCEGSDLGEKYFHTVLGSMGSLLMRGTLPDFADWMDEINLTSAWLGIVYLFFILVSTLTVMNMLIGVLVEVVSSVALRRMRK
jgi:hypothetical protein